MTTDAEEPKLHAQRQYKEVRKKLGKKPSLTEFCRESGITKGQLELIYGSTAFSKLVTECGDLPTAFGKPKSALSEILQTWGQFARELGRIPFMADWKQRRLAPSVTGIKMSHGIAWSQMPNAFLNDFGTDPKWRDVLAMIPAEISKESPAPARNSAEQLPLFVSQFLPPAVADLAELSQNDGRANDFERKVNLTFQLLGFEVTSMGQGTGRNPDAIARANQEHFGLLIDAKARTDSYAMGTEDRKFIEYIQQHQPGLAREGYRKLYFVIVSSKFAGSDMASILRVKHETQIPVIEIRADQLLRILAFMIEHPLHYDRSKFERLLIREGELSDGAIDKAFKK